MKTLELIQQQHEELEKRCADLEARIMQDQDLVASALKYHSKYKYLYEHEQRKRRRAENRLNLVRLCLNG